MKILVIGPFIDESIARLREHHDVTWVPQIDKQRMMAELPEHDCLIVRGMVIDAAVMDRGARLKVIGTPAVGLDKIDVAYARQKGIVVCNTPGANSAAVAELTIGVIIALARNIPEQSQRVKKDRRWVREKGHELSAKTLGLVGLGNIGKRVARIAAAMDMRVLAYDPYVTRETASAAGVESVTLDQMLRESDVVAIHAPHTAETHYLISAAELEHMKPGVYIVNMSRGGIIDEAALAAALASGRVAGVGTDVLEGEALDAAITSPLIEADNTIITPHLGAWTHETERRVTTVLVDKVLGALAHAKGEQR
jgi:D-3-phosphoglycerate dehydrogenase